MYWLQGDSCTAQQIEWTRDTGLAANFVPVGGGAKALPRFAKDAFKAGRAKAESAGALTGVAGAEAALPGSTNHIGSTWDSPTSTTWNPSAKRENCVACVASYITDRLDGEAGAFLTADDVERIYASVHPSRGLQLPEAVEILHRASKSETPPVKQSPFSPDAPVGQYALFFGPREDQLRHVIHAEVLPNNGGVKMFDPQNGQVVKVDDLLSLRIRWGIVLKAP